ncbi:MAG: HisA/HisF-related TIM barrel protein [Ignisphaera sp.]|uniref:HisA/HisF family protein n=1 Tax=Ignisphaera aggregans TaxID=334771 RepID=A0A7J3MWB6_9CREN
MVIDIIKVIPVLDIMNGYVVQAIAGERDKYGPLIYSIVSRSPDPRDVLRGFKNLGCDTVYIADIDAIVGKGKNDYVIEIALSLGLKVWTDIGREGLTKTDSDDIRYIIGTEYLVYPDDLYLLKNKFVSLDIKQNYVLFQNTKLDVVHAAKLVCDKGAKMILILFLDRVGTSKGINLEVVNMVKKTCNNIDVAVGGGLRNAEELLLLKKFGVNYALVATAIHKGVIDRCEY